MKPKPNSQINKPYLFFIILLLFVLPMLSVIIEHYAGKEQSSLISLVGKWFIFWAVGLRLFIAGLRQTLNPSFTAESIFHITNKESFVIVRELGFANICMGAAGVISLFVPQWRMTAAFAGGLYLGIAGINHIIKKPTSSNEWIAMVSDIIIFLVMLVCIINYI
jgi:uncharacterized protein DUF6790